MPSSSCAFASSRIHDSADLLGPLTGTPDMTPAINIRPGSKDPVPAAPQAEFLPQDEYNAKLVGNVGPTDYVNPEPLEKYDLVSRHWDGRAQSGGWRTLSYHTVVLCVERLRVRSVLTATG